MSPQVLAALRVDASDQLSEFALVHDAFELQSLGASSCPDARRLASTGVVVVQPGRDGALVVVLLTRRELRDAQHSEAHYSISTHLWVE